MFIDFSAGSLNSFGYSPPVYGHSTSDLRTWWWIAADVTFSLPHPILHACQAGLSCDGCTEGIIEQ